MRLVDADRIVYSWIIDKDGEEHDGVTLQSVIDKMPTADAVPVVRCKDCKFYHKRKRWCKRLGFVLVVFNENDFCSWGERKEDV